ncbi:MAG: DUF4340 domain-containing protein [Myxococcota bacterium]
MKSVLVHGGLAVLALIAAWMVWTDDDSGEASEESVELLDCDRLGHVALTSTEREVRIDRSEDDGNPLAWIRVQRLGEEAEDEEPKEYLAKEEAIEWTEGFEPFRAARSLGEVEEDLMEDLELNDESPVLAVHCAGGDSKEYRVGGATFGTRGQRYLQASDGGPVYLVDGAVVSQLQGAENAFAQRQLHTFEWPQVAQLELNIGDSSITMQQRDRAEARLAFWVDAADPETRNDTLGNWISRLRGLSVLEYLAADQGPGEELESSAEVSDVLRVSYSDGEGESIGSLELKRVEAPDLTYYARSETSRRWVKVPNSVARFVEDDGREILSLEAIVREEPSNESSPDAEGTEGTDPEGSSSEEGDTAEDGTAEDGTAEDGTAEGDTAEGDTAEGAAPEGAAPLNNGPAPVPGLPPGHP